MLGRFHWWRASKPSQGMSQDGEWHERRPGFMMVMAALELASIPGKCCGAMFGRSERRESLAASQSTTTSSGCHSEASAVIVYGWPSLHVVRENVINLRPISYGLRSTGIAACPWHPDAPGKTARNLAWNDHAET